MKPPDIIEVILKVVKVFEEFNIAYHLGGSLASSAFGVARSTLDADIAADIRLKQAPFIFKLFKEEFYVDIGMINNAIQHRSSFNLIHLDTMFKVDIFIPKDRAFDRMIFERRVQKAVSEDESKLIFFATPEDIILHKLEWYKSGGEVSDRQWSDILGVLKVQGSQLNTSYLKQWAEELSVIDLLEKAFDEAG